MTTMRGTLTGVLAAAAILACPVQSQASGVHVGIVISAGDYRGQRPHYRQDTYRLGYERGAREGWREGYQDARRNRHYGYADDRGYRNADAGYRRQHGPRGLYASGYRRGYEESYRRGFAEGRRQCNLRHDHERYDRDWQRDGRNDRNRYDDDRDWR